MFIVSANLVPRILEEKANNDSILAVDCHISHRPGNEKHIFMIYFIYQILCRFIIWKIETKAVVVFSNVRWIVFWFFIHAFSDENIYISQENDPKWKLSWKKGTRQKLLSGFYPLRGYPPSPPPTPLTDNHFPKKPLVDRGVQSRMEWKTQKFEK